MQQLIVEAQIGGREVIASGSLTTHRNDTSISLTLSDLRFDIAFVDDTAIKSAKVESDGVLPGAKALSIRLKNFTNQLGIAYDSNVGVFNGRILYLGIYVHSITADPHRYYLFNYTFTLGGAAS